MKILAFEFSSPQRSVAVVQSGVSGFSISEIVESGPGVARGLEMAGEALRRAELEREQIECIALGLGPGSYTGIRAAIAMAQGWQLARGVKLLGISTAQCIASQAQAEEMTGRVNVIIDAQREEFYLATYDLAATGCQEIAPLRLATLADVRGRETAGEVLIGPEVTRWFANGKIVFPRAATLGRLAANRTDFAAGEKLEPIYLREVSFVKAPPPRVIL